MQLTEAALLCITVTLKCVILLFVFCLCTAQQTALLLVAVFKNAFLDL